MKIMIKAALAAGSIFAGTAVQAELTSPEFVGVEATGPVEQVPATTDQRDVAIEPAIPALALATPAVELNLPTLGEAIALAAIDADGLVSDKELGNQRAGDTIVVGDQELSQVMAHNVLNGDYVAGNVTISDNAFSNFTGIGNVLINTGGLTSVQSGINVTINNVTNNTGQ